MGAVMSVDFLTVFNALIAKSSKYYGKTLTEEATKHFLILPFISALGYDVFDISEVMPEYTADSGVKQKGRIDYAIFKNGHPIILIECKSVSSSLSLKNEAQLLRYYHTSKARFAILTNGVQYKFYTDSENENVMDSSPFYELNLSSPDLSELHILEKFQKNKFNEMLLFDVAKRHRHEIVAKKILLKEFKSPSDELLHFLMLKMYPNMRLTQKKKNELTPIIRSSFIAIIKDFSEADPTINQQEELFEKTHQEIITTNDEKDAFYAIRGMLLQLVPSERIFLRDAKSYCAVLFDNNNRRPIARLYFNNPNKLMLGLFLKRKEEKVVISSLKDIYHFQEKFLLTAKKYLKLHK